MAQWFALKARHPEALLFFRMGDFFEMFFADAEAAAAALDIALTSRGEHEGAPIPMCGVPVATAESYLARLIRRGFRVAVAEQMEPAGARSGKAPIRREIVRLITPGTLTEDGLLEARRPNLLLALSGLGADLGAAWLDVSTGAFETAAIAATGLFSLLGRLDPAEILAPEELPLGEWEGRRAPAGSAPPPLAARRRVAEAFGAADIEAFGTFSDAEAMAAALALDYVRLTQAGRLPRLARPVSTGLAGQLAMDAATRASLEITRARDPLGAGDANRHTLLAAVDRSVTAPGARLLAAWLSAPLTAAAPIAARQESWAWLLGVPATMQDLREVLRRTPDIARALARLSLGRGGPRDLGALRSGLAVAAAAADTITAAIRDEPGLRLPPLLDVARQELAADPTLAALLDRALAAELPLRLEEGGVIAPGFDGVLDAERRLRDEGRRLVSRLQLDFAQRYRVASLKIRHHAQLGYVIEVPAAAVDALRGHPELSLRQGMANGARFTHPELAELDRRINEAAERAATRERTLFDELAAAALAAADSVAAAAAALATLDALQSCARLAEGGSWCRPEITEDATFRISAGRHPVVEAALSGSGAFVPNDCDLSPERRVLLLTGPNMAGKSTYLRQNALAVILAQAGLPVPARRAEIGIVDRLFSRVGAADELARGRSTFMVEMIETAAILHQAGPRSLVVVDEIGRGTATLDGLAIAWAVLEALHDLLRCRTIFATHFHELARLTPRLRRLCPHTMRVRAWRGDVVFLHEVAEGAAGRSWGVHVARLAGVPEATVRRAGALLDQLERERRGEAELPLFAAAPPPGAAAFGEVASAAAAPAGDEAGIRGEGATATAPASSDAAELQLAAATAGTGPMAATDASAAIVAALAALDPDELSPRAALDALYRLKALVAAG